MDQYITDEGCPLVANFLKTHSHFQEVDLKSNKITPNGFLKLCEGLREMKRLSVLAVNNNYLGQDNRGLEGLYSLMVNMDLQIKELYLRNNEINDDNLKPLLAILQESKSLCQLDLRMNKITTIGGEKILKVLDSASWPVQVLITGNKVK